MLGQFEKTFLICESTEKELILVDQHAAHEQIGFCELKNQQAARGVRTQRLLMPRTWEVEVKSFSLLEPHLDSLRQAGLEVEPFGEKTFVVKAIPEIVSEDQVIEILEKIVEEVETLDRASSLEKVTDSILKTVACHQQVRAHDFLSNGEIETLLEDMDRFGVTHCPHGRPVAVTLTIDDVEKWFKRT